MRVTKSKKSKVAVGATIAVLMLGGGAAFAYFSSSGSTTGAGLTGTSTAFTVSSAAFGGSAFLLPGVGAQTVVFTVSNPTGAGHQILNGVSVAVAGAAGATWTPTSPNVGCSSADYTVTVTTAPEYSDMAPGETRTGTATLLMTNRNVLQDFCKNAPVPLYFVAS